MAFSLGEYQDIFLEEADEQLQELNQNLLELEKNPENLEIINNIFRAAHSLKSSAAFVGLNELSDLAHMMENLLQGIRDGSMKVSSQIIDIIFKCFDEIHNIIDTIASGEKPEQDLQWLINDIRAICEKTVKQGEEKKKPAGVRSAGEDRQEMPKAVIDADTRKRIKDGVERGKSCSEITVYIDDKAQMKWVKAQLVVSNMERLGEILVTSPPIEDFNDDERNSIIKIILLSDADIEDIKRAANIDLIYRIELRPISLGMKEGKQALQFGDMESYNTEDEMEGAGVTAEADMAEAEKPYAEEEETGEDVPDEDEEGEMHEEEKIAVHGGDKAEERHKVTVLKTVKVSIDKLDLLLNNVGELVIANSGFFKLYEEMRKIYEEKSLVNEFKSRMEQMSRIAKDLQSGIMKTRMVPIGQVFTRFRRLIRDLAKEYNKDIELTIKGEDTELDKKVIDSIGEPLLHLLRNAVDHGIESASDRKKLGKSEVAHITMNAYQGGNQIFVEVSDDGHGLNLDQIKRKAISMGLATPEMLSAMDDQDIYNYIFVPGFSTAEKVTDMSGRGVGMNVVKEIVNELNGNVTIETEAGMGTRFVLAFPITLAIIPAIMVKVRHEMYAIPLTDVIETIKISHTDITTIEGHEVINLRGEILSLLRLSRFIKLDSVLGPDDKMPVVVVGFGNRKIGLIVDYLEGKQEIVIKSLEQNYMTVEGLAGASILGDGSICLILDIASMINKVIAEQDKISKYDRNRIVDSGEADVEEVDQEDITAKQAPGSALKHASVKPAAAAAKEPVKEAAPRRPAQAEKKEEKAPSLKAREPARGNAAAEMASDNQIEKRVHDTLDEFRSELRESIKSTASTGDPSSHMIGALDLTPGDLTEFQLIANVGATNAAESLSKILKKRIDLSIPEVTLMPLEQIPRHIGDIDSIYMGVMMPVLGDARGTVLFIFNEKTGYEVIDLLYGMSTSRTKELNEDGESALQELTNIVGSSVINIIAEKTGLVIRAGIPTIVHDYLQSVIDSILVLHSLINDYAIVMDTAFFFENDRIIGNLLILPEADSLKMIVDRMRSHVGSN